MEKRRLKMIFNKSKQGTLSPRITIPSSWTRELHINEDEREVNVYFINNQIIIAKEEVKMNKDLVMAEIKNEIKKEMEEKKYICDSDNTDRFVDKLVMNILENFSNQEEIEECAAELIEKANKFLEENYKRIGTVANNGDYIGYYYVNNCHFETIEELEKFFRISE